MKTIIALFFFGVVTYAYKPKPLPTVDKCKEVTPMSNFQSSQFFKGKWIVTQAKDITTSVCHQFDTEIKSGTITVTADGFYEIGGKRALYKVPCTSTGNGQSGKFSLTCQPKRTDSQSRNTINVQVEVTVMATDYNRYAVVYRCATSGSVKTENYLVLQRKENEEISELKNILQGKGLDSDKLLSRKKSTNVCKPAA